ncbi:MAG TPA: MATE family efflux transporter, partial [Myxococcaceae bacterium]|nr:MATE family efflux transporter [Myxococcaceae bacterium]
MPSVRPIAKELRALTVLALPIAAGQAGFALMGLVDTAVVGRLGAGPLGAVGLANGLFFAISVIGIGTMMGLDPLISQALGARDERRARELLWQGLWLGAALSAALTVAVLAVPALLRPAGIEPSVAEDTRAFLWMRVIGMAPMLWFVGIRSYLQAVGRVRSLLTAAVVANVLNLCGDVLFVYGGARLPAWTGVLRSVPAFGAAGAGLTTSVCSFIQVAIIAWPAWRTPWRGGPARRRARMADLIKATRVGLPVGMQMAAEVGVFALAGLFAGRMGK